MKPPKFSYCRPETTAEVVGLLAEYGDEAKPLAGGQSLMPLLNLRFARPSVLIDISGIEEIKSVDNREGVLSIGAMVTQSAMGSSVGRWPEFSILGTAIGHIGHPQIRNRGTIGGSIAHADPAAELPAVALVLEATVVLQGTLGQRRVEAEHFFLGPFMTAAEPDELVVGVEMPIALGARTAFLEVARRAGDFALSGVGAVVTTEQTGIVSRARLAGFGVGGAARRLRAAEAALLERSLVADVIDEAAHAASSEIDPFSDVHADADLRRHLLGVLVRRALEEVSA